MSNRVSRRGFIDRAISLGAVGLTAAGLCVCVASGCLKKDQTPEIPAKWLETKEDRVIIHVQKVKNLRNVGGVAKFDHPKGREKIVVVHPATGRFVALSGLCTHRGRPLEYNHSTRQLRCINYGHSRFGLDGVPLTGPAKRPLKLYRTLYLGGKLEVFL